VSAERLRVAVIGVGHLGRHHARILSALEGVELVAVVDTNTERAAAAAAGTGAPALADYREVLDAVDAVSIAVPTELHRDIALPFLQTGVSALVEKPIARSLDEADELVAAAKASGAVLGVGHTERYNPAVAAVLPLVTSPRFIEVHRLGAFPDRSLDIDVVFDLMIHDLDIILALVRSDVVSIDAVGVPVLTSKYDIANARLRFASGCIANVTASRISKERVRKIRFFQPDAYISIDYAAQEVEGWRQDAMERVVEGALPVERDEPLRREIADCAGRSNRIARSSMGTRDAGRWISETQEWRKMARRRRGARLSLPRQYRNFGTARDLNEFIWHSTSPRAGAHHRTGDGPGDLRSRTESKSPGGGPGLLFERPTGFDIPSR
jgi:predicted dehydrogenase